jgi:hypothetical protein
MKASPIQDGEIIGLRERRRGADRLSKCPIRIDRPTPDSIDTGANPLLMGNGKGDALAFLGGTCPF